MSSARANDVASYLPRSLLSKVSGGNSDAAIENLYASVISVDIAGFTRITEQLVREPSAGVDRLSRILNAFYGDLIDKVEAHGGELVSIVGDGTIAVWPCGEAGLARATRRAASCGLELSRAFDGYRADDDTTLRVRTGLGSGTFTVARLGNSSRFELTVTGDAVDDAVAAEQLAAPGAFAVAPRAWPLLHTDRRGQDLRDGFVQVGSLSIDSAEPLSRRPLPYDEATLLSYLPVPVRARVTGSSATLWQAEVRHVSVGFYRFRTPTGADLSVTQAQQAITLLGDTLAHYGGAIDKVTFHDKGCVATAVFGLPPHAYEDDARRAVSAALEALERARAHDIEVSVGVSSGSVFWGPIGHTSRRQFGLIGSAMNLGSRLMQQAYGDVLCCPRTVEALADRANGQLIGNFSLKGFEHPVPVFRATSVATARNLRRRSLGREAEQARLAQVLRAAREGRGELLWLEAGPGLGKSALVTELLSDARGESLRALMGVADPVEQDTPYHAWKSPIAELLGVDAPLAAHERAARVVTQVDELPGLRGLAPLLSQMLGLPIPDTAQTLRLDGVARADRTADLLLALLERESRGGLLLILEDLHWFDSASLRVAHLVQRRLGSVPLVITTRPSPGTPDELFANLRSKAELLPVLPLPEERIMELVALGLGAREVAPDARAFMNERADGNPLFAKSLTRELGAAGVLKVVDGVVRLQPEAARLHERVPRSLDAIIGTRVDRLSATDSLTLKAASAIGPSFQFEVVRAIHPDSPTREQLLASLSALEAERLIVPLGKGDAFAFDHAVTHEVTYTRITPQQREQLHAKIAEWHDRARAAESEAHHPLLAHHYERAGLTRLACQFLSMAAEQALRSGAFREGARFLERAIAQALRKPDPAITPLRRARWHRQLAETLDSLGEKDRMGVYARQALKELGQTEPKTNAGQVALMVRDAVAQAVALSINVRVRSVPPEVAFELSRAHLCLTSHYFYAMQPLGMVANTLRATNAAEHTGKSSERARCYAGMSLWLGIVGQRRLARGYAERAVKACADAPDDPGVVAALCVAALYYVGVGNFVEAEQCCAAAQQEADPRNDHAWWCIAQAIKIWTFVYRAQTDGIAIEASRLRARAKQADSEHLMAWATRFEAHRLLARGNAAEACSMFREVLPVVKRHADRAEELLVQSSLALALVRTGQAEEARGLLQATLALLATLDRPTSHIVLQGLSDLMHAVGTLLAEAPTDAELLAVRQATLHALDNYQRAFPIGAPRALHFQGQAERARGRPGHAAALFRRGLTLASELGLPEDEALLRADLGPNLI